MSGAERHELEQELAATLQARQEVGRELEPHLVEGFVDKLEAEIDRRVDQRLAQQRREIRPHRPGTVTPMVLGSLGIAIPLMAIAGSMAGFGGIALVCLAIVLVNFFWATRG